MNTATVSYTQKNYHLSIIQFEPNLFESALLYRSLHQVPIHGLDIVDVSA